MDKNKKIADLIDKIKELSVVEINELVKELEIVFNVKAANMTAQQDPGKGGTSDDNAEAEGEGSDDVTIILKSVGASKVAVIKLVKEVLGVDLMKAKKITETVPVPIKEKISRTEAAELAEKFTLIGAETQIK